ncbi:MAG: 3-methyladenine DNA glycosylase [Leifsonia sp.]|nr:3-methyladenine DNA glycosylase [Leifsonia sp.]
MEPLRMRYTPDREVRLALTLSPFGQGRTDPCVRRTPEGWWLALSTPAGSATLLLRESSGAVDALAWGTGAAEALDTVPRLLGADDDEDGFEPARHPLVAELHRRFRGLRHGRADRILPFLVPTILGQKVTGVEQKRAWRELVRRHGEPAPGPAPEGMRVAPDAATWRRVPSWEWHRAGVGPQRSDTVMRAVQLGDSLERLVRRSAVEAVAGLTTVPGIGVWTAAEVVQRSHGDADHVSVGDYHVSRRVGAALLGDAVLGRDVDDDRMLELLEPWRGHRHRVVRLIEAAGIGYQRRGPRMTIVDNRAR